MRVEHTPARSSLTSAGFEDREDHRIPFASVAFYLQRLTSKTKLVQVRYCMTKISPGAVNGEKSRSVGIVTRHVISTKHPRVFTFDITRQEATASASRSRTFLHVLWSLLCVMGQLYDSRIGSQWELRMTGQNPWFHWYMLVPFLAALLCPVLGSMELLA